MKGLMTKRPADVFASASANNSTATATLAAGGAGARIHLTHVSAGFPSAVTKLLTIKRGTTVIMTIPVVTGTHIQFDPPLQGNAAEAMSAELEASGTGGVLGYVNLAGYKL
jgi:monoamine oxidase